MERNSGTIVLCLVLGAAVMYCSTNFRIHVEQVPVPGAKAPPADAPAPAPQPLPTGMVRGGQPAPVLMPDPNVRQTQASAQAAVADADAAVTPQITAVTAGALNWPLPAPSAGLISSTPTVKVTLGPIKDQTELWLAIGGQKKLIPEVDSEGFSRSPDKANPPVVTLDLSKLANKTSGEFQLELWARTNVVDTATPPTKGFSKDPVRLKLLAPTVAPDRSVEVIELSNSPFLSVSRQTGTIDVFGKPQFDPYLLLSANVKGLATRFRFVLQTTTPAGGQAIELGTESETRTAAGVWNVLPKLPLLPDGTVADLFVFAEATDARVFAAAPVSIKFNFIPEALDAPTLTLPPVSADTGKTVNSTVAPTPFSTPGLPAYYTNATKFNLTVTTSPANAKALVYYIDSDNPKVPGVAASNGVAFNNLAVGPGRDHVIRVAATRGRFIGPTAQVKLLVETAPPAVDAVTPQPGFGSSNGVGNEKITVRFNPSNPINWKQDSDTKFKVIHRENPTRDTGNLVTGVTTFDAATNTVTLNVQKVLPGSYLVAITTGIEDVFGNPLPQSPNVSDKTNFFEFVVFTQGAGADKALASRSVGITNQTGPAVTYPEYVKFRLSPDGFNPSDRVETRVMRLYYYRDAHRVAQLINRTVKSYNAATVDVRRRAADAVRDNADKAQDDRQVLEARAVQAAQESRASEAELANLQNGIATARNQSAVARIELLQRQQELEVAKRDLARADLLTPGRVNSDAALETQRLAVDVERRELARVEQEITATNPAPDAGRLRELNLLRLDKQSRLDAEQRKLDRLLADNQTRVDSGSDALRARVRALETEIGKLQSVSTTADLVERANSDRIAAAQSTLAGKRELENKAVEAWQVKELQERRLRENQFRTETAALREDPDTYAAGDPNSVDAVMQVSVAVIGEGLIQLRGPIKGLNVIRTMVNQIDTPVGQVRVAVHTLQVNGERADRMEKVVANIQRYLDHSRFLTAQSGQMLRNAVTSVASRKAAEVAATLAPGCTQWDRDQKYLYSFFGKDFIDELIQLDSEFLKTGNKLLSLNSMDSTSLSSAMFLLALAKNDVRTEIISEFLSVVQSELPQAEWKYYAAGISQPKHCDACKDKKEYLLAFNSQFQSFIGFFNAQVVGTDTLNPLQREFVKLAQIFKARMVTEMQLRQRVMERALLEERFGTKYLEELKKAKDLEDMAKAELARTRTDLGTTKDDINKQLLILVARIAEVQTTAANLIADCEQIDQATKDLPTSTLAVAEQSGSTNVVAGFIAGIAGQQPRPFTITLGGKPRVVQLVPVPRVMPNGQTIIEFGFDPLPELADYVDGLTRLRNYLTQFTFGGPTTERFKKLDAVIQYVDAVRKPSASKIPGTDYITWNGVKALKENIQAVKAVIDDASALARGNAQELLLAFGADDLDQKRVTEVFQRYSALRTNVLTGVQGDLLKEAQDMVAKLDVSLNGFLVGFSRYQAARKNAQDARRPIDEKKLLDMLVDEMEDKFVEILEGTRAHTANVDNYLKSIATALDDDFNTQYYLPSFRRAREASRYWDVTLAQIETTSVLTNNRALGKVQPAASFEFDLPKRDILITEGFKSAKALFDEYGALMNDPSFLSLAKIYSGNPVSMMQGGGGGLSAVRNVLPGLPTSADEKILAQAGPGQKQFGAALDGLIPDPAIYKFETGTGYEIRPVLSPDGQAVVFGFDYMYTTDVREPVRADEKHLGRVKRHFVSTDVQLGNYELREVSKYMVSIKVARTGKGVQLLQDIPGVGVLFRPLPSAGASLQQNLIYSQATIFPTLFDLMGLRYAPAVADLDPLADRMAEFAARYRRLDVEQRVYDIGSTRVDDALRTPYGERRYDLYRPPVSLPFVHPNGYTGVGLRLYDGTLREGYDPNAAFPDSRFAPGTSLEGRPKPYPSGVPGYPGSDVPPGFGPLPPSFSPEYALPPGASSGRPLPPNAPPLGTGVPKLTAPPGTGSTGTAGAPNTMRLPGMGSVGVGRPVPFNPALSTSPPPLRSSELPTTNAQTVVSPNPPVPRPSTPAPFPPARPQPGLPPLPAVPLGSR